MPTAGDSGNPFRLTRAYRARSPWRPWRAIIATLLIYFGGVWALSAVISFDKTLRGMGRPEGLWREDVATLVTVGIWQLVTIALTLAVSAMGRGRVKDVLALRPAVGGFRMYAVALGLTVLLQVLLTVVMPWLFPAPDQAKPEATALLGDRWWLALLVIGMGAPLAEEFLFRGFLLSALARPWGFWLSACIANAWWTFLHAGYSPAGFASVFAMGLLYTWQLWRSGSLRVPLLCHAVHNGLVIVVFGQLSV